MAPNVDNGLMYLQSLLQLTKRMWTYNLTDVNTIHKKTSSLKSVSEIINKNSLLSLWAKEQCKLNHFVT
jgi:hypothetical protein